jgi:cytidine deaminase
VTEDLIRAARRARERAYCPYSRYAVGAALLADDGNVYCGANVENASYGLTICAERAAVAAMVSAGRTRILAIAIATQDAGSPCGACRQVLAEFAEPDLPIVCLGEAGEARTFTLGELLPFAFGPPGGPGSK